MKEEKIYIIGFPKSGNTWLSRLIAEALDSNIKYDLINTIDNSINRKGKYEINKIHYTQNLEKLIGCKKIYIIRDPRAVFVSGFFHNYRRISEKLIANNFLINLLFKYEIKYLNNQWNGNIFRRILFNLYLLLRTIFIKTKKNHVGNWSDHVNFWSNNSDIV